LTVLEEILTWSKDRPAWQRDALRRLVLNGNLSDGDILAVTEICKGAHGLTEQQDVIPLSGDHIPEKTATAPVSLVSIFHHRGVNALAEDQTLRFGPNLTVVYGDNAAGKTGYIRILKSACRARGQEQILGNVVSGRTPLSPTISIKYKVGTEVELREWAGGEDDFISHVSVFDTQCASVYLTEKTDVAFRPFGLDLFDKLVRVCKEVRVQLEREQRALASSALVALQAEIPQGTAVARLLGNISSLTKPETVENLARLSPEENARLAFLDKSLLDLQTNDPQKLIRQLSLRAGRINALTRHLKHVEATLSAEAVGAVFDARTKGRRMSEEAKKIRKKTLPNNVLGGTGSDDWAALWESARQFSENQAYPEQEFPVVESGALCLLCQQGIDHPTGHRLTQFEAFVASSAERELRQIRQTFAGLRKDFIDLATTTETIKETLDEIAIENEPVANAITAALMGNENRRIAIVRALVEDIDLDADCAPVVSAAYEADILTKQIEMRIQALRTTIADETRKSMVAESQELRARKWLATREQTVLNDIERRKRYAAYGLCIEETRTQTITQKSTAVTKTAVSQRLKQSFKDELLCLAFHHVEVELKEVGGAEGVLYHKLILTRAPGVELPKVVSEGEQRCLSITAFFAELSTADDPSGIVFDDPVSSLDYKWREAVARRLVEEAKCRQVIVFTHDVVFLLLLKQFAEDFDVDQLDQHVRYLSKGSGVCADELPWVALPVKKKIGYLNNEWQATDKLFRDGHQAAYEKEAKYLYGLLREAWERALEEVLLGGIIERFRPGVQTQHIGIIADITDEDCQTVDSAMSKCSKWLPGHDQAAAARAPVPEPSELKADIQELENWVTAIRKRR
jgi:ABC-type lipoprotein export system ATPase subunit